MAGLICKKCGGEMRILPGTSIAICDSCGACVSADPQHRNRDGKRLLEDAYGQALDRAKTADDPEALRELEAFFLALGDYRDSVALARHCRKRLGDLRDERARAEAERQEAYARLAHARQQEEAEARRRQQERDRLLSLCAAHNKALTKKLLLLELAFAMAGGLLVTCAFWNGSGFLFYWIAACLIHCLFVLPVAAPTLLSFRLRSRGSALAGTVTVIARILAILAALFWILTFVFSLFGEDRNVFMRIWCLVETAAALASFVLSRQSKALESEM